MRDLLGPLRRLKLLSAVTSGLSERRRPETSFLAVTMLGSRPAAASPPACQPLRRFRDRGRCSDGAPASPRRAGPGPDKNFRRAMERIDPSCANSRNIADRRGPCRPPRSLSAWPTRLDEFEPGSTARSSPRRAGHRFSAMIRLSYRTILAYVRGADERIKARASTACLGLPHRARALRETAKATPCKNPDAAPAFASISIGHSACRNWPLLRLQIAMCAMRRSIRRDIGRAFSAEIARQRRSAGRCVSTIFSLGGGTPS